MANFIGSYPPPNNILTKPAIGWELTPEGYFAYLDDKPGKSSPYGFYDPNDITDALYEQRQQLKQLMISNAQDRKDAKRAEMMDKIQNDQTSLQIAESAFNTMLSSCVNTGQYTKLVEIKDEGIKDMPAGPVRSFTTYMNKWKGVLGV